jgi:hypothetical protein
MSSGAASLPGVEGPCASRSSIERRTGSARAENVLSRVVLE